MAAKKEYIATKYLLHEGTVIPTGETVNGLSAKQAQDLLGKGLVEEVTNNTSEAEKGAETPKKTNKREG